MLNDTFPVRLAGDERMWIIYNVHEESTNRKVALRLTNIKPNCEQQDILSMKVRICLNNVWG